MSNPIQAVIDTNVFLAALKSRSGASAKLLSMLPNAKWENNVSSAPLLEYEEKAKDPRLEIQLTIAQIDQILDKVAAISNCCMISKPRQARLKDADDDFVLDLVEAANATVTFNQRIFVVARTLGIEVLTPGEFWKRI